MKILFIIHQIGYGGAERQLLELLKGIAERPDMECALFVLNREIHYQYVQDLPVALHYYERKTQRDLGVFRQLYRLCRRFRPDVIQSWDSMCTIYATPVARWLKIPFINFMIQNAPADLRPFQKNWVRSRVTFPFSDIVLANSRAGLAAYRAPESKSRCIHNGFDHRRIGNLPTPSKVRTELGIDSGAVIGMVAGFKDSKDYHTYLNAAIAIAGSRDDVTFLAVGTGKNLDDCRKMVPPELSGKIIFTGLRQDVEALVNIFDIGVLATYTEGISNSIMEYMALGKPVVATDGGGTREILQDGVTGFLVTCGDAEDLAGRIQHLLDHPDQARKMGEAGRERLHNHFSIEQMTAQFIDLFNESRKMKAAAHA